MKAWIRKSLKGIAIVLGAVAIAGALRYFTYTPYLIPLEGMENSLFRGDRILVNRWSYGLRTPAMSWLGYHRWLSKPVHRGDIVVFNNPADTRNQAIDQRDVFISRCAGTPGDTLWVDSLFSLISSEKNLTPDSKQLYTYPRSREQELNRLLKRHSITGNELMGQDTSRNVRSFSRYEYHMLKQSMTGNTWLQPLDGDSIEEPYALVVPGKSRVLQVHPWNRVLLMNTLVLHEGKQARIIGDTLYVDGRPTWHCTFTKDYYWMVSDNNLNLSDSRLFGFVPQDHLIGKESVVLFSKEPNTGWMDGYRWNRFFLQVK